MSSVIEMIVGNLVREGINKHRARELAVHFIKLCNYTNGYCTGRTDLLEEQRLLHETDWKDMYEKQKRKADMWVAKYEADIGPVEKAGPVSAFYNDWKLVPRVATPEMLKAMDECSTEGYDQRLLEGIASSVYMAAWDASPAMGTLPPSKIFNKWFYSAPHRAKYASDHPAYLAAEEAWNAANEACARVCEEHPDGLNMMGGAFVACAEAIRARGSDV